MRRERAEERVALKRDIGLFGSFSMGYADVGADIYVALGLVALYSAGGSPLAFSLAAILYIATGLSYAELASTYPYAGGVQVYSMKAFNDLAGFIAGWMMLLSYTVDITLFAMASAGYLSFFVPAIGQASQVGPLRLGNLVISTLIIISFLIAINVLGVKESSTLNVMMVFPSLAVQMAILVVGFAFNFSLPMFLKQISEIGSPKLLDVSYIPFLDLRTQNFIYGVTLAMSSYVGIASIAQAAEETKKPYRWIPLAAKLSVLMVLIFAIGLSVLSMGMMSWQELASNLGSPLVAMAKRIAYIGVPLSYLVAFTGFTVNLASANTGVIGVSRIVFSMAKYDQMPGWFNQIHSRFRTPTRSILFFGAIGMILAFLGGLEKVADLYTFAALITYIFVNLAIFRLRKIDIEAYRPWKGPSIGNIPLTGFIGGIAALIILILMVIFHPIGRALGTLWLIFGLALYYMYRKAKGLPVMGRIYANEVKPAAYKMEVLAVVPYEIPSNMAADVLQSYFDRRHRLFLADLVSARDLNELRELEYLSESHLEEVASILRKKGYEVTTFIIRGGEEDLAEEAEPYDFVAIFWRGRLKGKIPGISKMLSERLKGRLVMLRVR